MIPQTTAAQCLAAERDQVQAEFDEIAADAGLWDKLLAIEELEEQQALLATNRQVSCTPSVVLSLKDDPPDKPGCFALH